MRLLDLPEFTNTADWNLLRSHENTVSPDGGGEPVTYTHTLRTPEKVGGIFNIDDWNISGGFTFSFGR